MDITEAGTLIDRRVMDVALKEAVLGNKAPFAITLMGHYGNMVPCMAWCICHAVNPPPPVQHSWSGLGRKQAGFTALSSGQP